MDDELLKLTGTSDEDLSIKVKGLDGKIEFEIAGDSREYQLKPLRELYGKGFNAPTIVPDSPEYMPLFMGIEQKIVDYWQADPSLTDAIVSLALDQLAINPEANAAPDDLASYLQLALRLQLSFNDYSRKDVQRALRIINKSVNRHSKDGGRQGYLQFIRRFLG